MWVGTEDVEAYKAFCLLRRPGLHAEAPEDQRAGAEAADEERMLRDVVRLVEEQALEPDEKTLFDDVMRNVPRASGLGSSQWRWEQFWAVHVSRSVRKPSGVEFVDGGKMMSAVVCGWTAGSPERGGGLLFSVLGVRPIACGEAALDRHPEWVYVEADAKSAFNALLREAVLEAIEQNFPELWA
ncbi:hypothetical protein CYMTET_45482 [Cymbomonas tetramitiformis]|uniref:Uncharacterized protein n=1 Tax=Cymbomonas tetramitiformis TaxID=36881 RepID=A0AAE0BY53_9CHLO|nr:hypothetical protein CYMTET_45482 [Cymbomonas tetramitiformis]